MNVPHRHGVGGKKTLVNCSSFLGLIKPSRICLLHFPLAEFLLFSRGICVYPFLPFAFFLGVFFSLMEFVLLGMMMVLYLYMRTVTCMFDISICLLLLLLLFLLYNDNDNDVNDDDNEGRCK
ncbi:hypothetical protein DM02DRAFT_358750 [Periconia macrospinosa]|uniref:Uncharacterized protein n=1 Tax=Periconia macrospinosa TaxID=97972 RepID=A0A2V1DVN1_9PLEO|nr:hypothetical protein DM02DRAFT_358750 [Periconia macrospinosa]